MSASPLAIAVGSSLVGRAHRAGFLLTTALATTTATPAAVLRAWAQGSREVICTVETVEQLLALRPLALFAVTFGEIIRTGSFRELPLTTGGLRATAWDTRQQGGLILIENPTAETCQGSVFPAVEELTLSPHGIVAWLHDTPIGASSHYLAAYAGLVKSEAQVLTAQIRPDPFEGIRLFVFAPVGAQRELVLFNAGPGEAVSLSFTEVPQVVSVAPSQVICVPEGLEGRVWLGEGDAPTWIGPDDVTDGGAVEMGPHRLWELSSAGVLTEIFFGTETDQLTRAGWYAAQIDGGGEPILVQINFEWEVPLTFWLNGERISGKELRLLPGDNRLVIHLSEATPMGQVTLLPEGACYLLELTRWRYWREGPLSL